MSGGVQSVISIIVACEDLLSESVLDRLLLESRKPYQVVNRLRKGGNDYLRSNAVTWNRTLVRQFPLLLLTDLDDGTCAAALRAAWLDKQAPHPNFLFRVAVREVEAWLMADRDQLARYLGVSASRIPNNPDSAADPKVTLFNAARKSSKRRIREGIPPIGSGHVGPEYNLILSSFVQTEWNLDHAMTRSESLCRAMAAIRSFQPQS